MPGKQQRAGFWLCALAGAALSTCSPQEQEQPLLQLLPPARTGIDFINRLSEGDSLNILNYIYYYNGGGVAIADLNGDGLDDIFFTANESSCRLYLNKGGMRFEDVTETAELSTHCWATGAALADANGDGYTDIYVCAAGKPEAHSRANLLFLNQGNGPDGLPRFREAAAEAGIADTSYSTHAAFFDYDRDGDLDLYVLNHANEREALNTPLPIKARGEGPSTDHLFRNDGQGHFTDVSEQAGIQVEGYGLGIAISDVNQDGWPDVYISNDFIYNDLLYINQADGAFHNEIGSYLRHQSYNAMGSDMADFNNDGRADIFTLDMQPAGRTRKKTMAGGLAYDKWSLMMSMGYEPQYVRNTLQLSNGPSPINGQGSFSEIGQLAGVHQTGWSWSGLFADYDNDGWKDLFITNGYLRDITDKDFIDYSTNLAMFQSPEKANRALLEQIRQLPGEKLANCLFRNTGNLTYEAVKAGWPASFSNGAAYGDLDNDGDLDLVVNNINEPAFLLENKAAQQPGHHFLSVELEGPEGNPEGIGAQLRLYRQGQVQFLEQYPSRGFQSAVSYILHFGLGQAEGADSLIITWPDGKAQKLVAVAAGQRLKLRYAQAKDAAPASVPGEHPLFSELHSSLGLSFEHRESPFNDFQYQPLLPHPFSRLGPCLAAGQLNDDGLEDLYIGGAKGQAGMLFFQQADGHFLSQSLEEGSESEDTGVLILDANGDGANDLYVVSGGSEFPLNSPAYQDRLYLGDGKGGLHLAPDALPQMNTSGFCVAAADFDGDGDADLFVGGRLEPGRYPMPPRSYLLRNEGGVFRDVTASLAPGLERVGMVTAAIWTGLGDGSLPGLLIVGEWMPITYFRNTGGNLEQDAGLALPASRGWWNCLAQGDFDHDGDPDFIAGNRGLNTPWRISEAEPMRVYASDFDENGSLDAIISYYVEGVETPMASRDALLAQVTSLERKYPRYALYAEATARNLFPPGQMEKAYTLACNNFNSCYIENAGSGRLVLHPLPIAAQMAPINSIICQDINGDGQLDALVVGNCYAADVNTGRYDAFNGLLLAGDGKGAFSPVPPRESGFWAAGDAKSIAWLTLASGEHLALAGINDGPMLVFKAQTITKQ
ncbi:MAG: VCBS repeat-containing protein [Lewinellaceae bacterium]|nr:VCBS repeat-containing protein [Lewinellaceae bacterium]